MLDWITDAFPERPNESETATFAFPLQFTCLRSVEKVWNEVGPREPA